MGGKITRYQWFSHKTLAPLALVAGSMGGGLVSALARKVYFWARVAHYGVTISGMPIPYRTAAFLVGFACQVTLAALILDRMV